MRPSIPVCVSSLVGFVLLVAGASPALAQGVVNRTLLAAPTDKAPPTWSSQCFAEIKSAVVHVCVEVDGPRGKYVFERASSGVIVDDSGLVVTLHRLVAEAAGAADKRLLIQLNDADNTRLPAELVGHDQASGLALLRFAPPAAGVRGAQLGPDRPRTGEPLLVVARPHGDEMLAFAGVASPALVRVTLAGREYAAGDVFLTDARNDERCDGAPVFTAAGALLGLYSSEHVQRDKSEPTLADLQQPSFGVVVPVGRLRAAFPAELALENAASRATARVDSAEAFVAAVARVRSAVVSVWSGDGEWPMPGAEDPGCMQRRAGLGSGVVISKKGLVVANLHVGAAGSAVRVKTVDGDEFAAVVVGADFTGNLCLLRLQLPAGRELTTAVCAPDEDVVLGEAMLAVGNPLGNEVVVSAGVVSAVRDREGGRIQADANLGNQNGGGAIVDVAGRLIGIGDAGLRDPLEMAFRRRGDRISQETNLSTFLGIAAVRRVFGKAIAAVALADESIVAPVPATPAIQQLRRSSLTAMVERASAAMLNIYVARNVAKVDEDDPFAEMAEQELKPLSLGSGVIIDRSGLAISNWHVVDDATNPDGSMRADHVVTASVFGGKSYAVRVLSISRENDLSLLQLQLEPGEEVHAVEFGNSDALGIGEAVAAFGNPHGRANTITYGVVSAKDQFINVRGRWEKLGPLIETDAAINGGNSGGALLDMNGRLVGINSAGGGTFNNKGYAIAVDHVRRQVLGLLFQAYKLRSPELGMRVLDDEGHVVVADVDPRGPAARAGVESGDRVTALGGTAITWSPGFAMQMRSRTAGEAVELQVERKGQPKAFSIVPLRPEVWAVIRQSGMACRDFGYAEDPERVRLASIALHRAFTGDPTGEPQQIPQQVVAVDRVFVEDQPDAEIRTGDLILALEPAEVGEHAAELKLIGSVADLRDQFNDRERGSYDGVKWRCWIARGSDVKRIEVLARRLLW